jgi:hypothetical protein
VSRRSFVMILALVALLAAAPAQAITYGQPDNGQHPAVGALIVDEAPAGDAELWCSGTLVAADKFLTAAHCTFDITSDALVYVSFAEDPMKDPGSWIPSDAGTEHPSYPGPSSDPHDLSVIVLSESQGTTPASLPALNQFTQMAKQNKNGLHGQKFTAVGYGASGRLHEPGQVFEYPDTRMYAVSTFRALNNAWLRLSMNPAHDDGGGCYGDSGGPNYLGAGDGETDMVAAITVTGDIPCRATNVVYRLDTASTQEFLSMQGVPLSGVNVKAKKASAGEDRDGGKRRHGRRR